jgi:hypothetical protein
MKTIERLVIGSAVVAVAFGTFALTTGPQAARPDGSSKRVVIACRPGWRGGAGGTYGGVPFDVSCNNGRGQTTIAGTVGTAYSIRMGVESATTGADCFFSGDSPVVGESCLEVGLTVR